MDKTISFFTIGCRLNQSETAVLKNLFESHNYRIVHPKEPADLAVINTCTVTQKCDADTRKLVSRINRINPKVKIALIGCQAQLQKESLLQLKNVHWIVGNGNKMDLVKILKESTNKHPMVIMPPFSQSSFTVPGTGIDPNHTRANIKIQDGCDCYCTFCEIPYARGMPRSREFDDILHEAKALAKAGYKELVVTGINVGNYRNQTYNIADVLRYLNNITGVERVRISSIEPTTIPDKILEMMAGKSKLCRHLHIPLQSGDDDILKSMNRKFTFEEFRNFILKSLRSVPEICIGTDIIVGFPGETDAHFARTYRHLDQLPIHYFHVFSYSQRKMAKSKDFLNKVPLNVIQKRSRILRELSQRKRLRYYESLLGTTQTVLFERTKNRYWRGVTDHYVHVRVLSNKDLSNQLVDVVLKDIDCQEVIGDIV